LSGIFRKDFSFGIFLAIFTTATSIILLKAGFVPGLIFSYVTSLLQWFTFCLASIDRILKLLGFEQEAFELSTRSLT
jgi:hypothetical protein